MYQLIMPLASSNACMTNTSLNQKAIVFLIHEQIQKWVGGGGWLLQGAIRDHLLLSFCHVIGSCWLSGLSGCYFTMK